MTPDIEEQLGAAMLAEARTMRAPNYGSPGPLPRDEIERERERQERQRRADARRWLKRQQTGGYEVTPGPSMADDRMPVGGAGQRLARGARAATNEGSILDWWDPT